MTLSPLAVADRHHLAVGVAGSPYKVGPYCAKPGCRHFADHAHHIFRRSMLAGAFPWVAIDGVRRGNLTGLCASCHDDITGKVGGHRAAIRLDVASGVFWWCEITEDERSLDFHRVGPLDPQPPTPETLSERALGQGSDESEHCPLCGQTKRRHGARSAGPLEPRRRRKSWTVSVPDDAERGADILDTFVDEVALMLGAGDWAERNRRYWALVHTLAWVMQRREEFARDIKVAA